MEITANGESFLIALTQKEGGSGGVIGARYQAGMLVTDNAFAGSLSYVQADHTISFMGKTYVKQHPPAVTTLSAESAPPVRPSPTAQPAPSAEGEDTWLMGDWGNTGMPRCVGGLHFKPDHTLVDWNGNSGRWELGPENEGTYLLTITISGRQPLDSILEPVAEDPVKTFTLQPQYGGFSSKWVRIKC